MAGLFFLPAARRALPEQQQLRGGALNTGEKVHNDQVQKAKTQHALHSKTQHVVRQAATDHGGGTVFGKLVFC